MKHQAKRRFLADTGHARKPCAVLLADRLPETPRPPGWVPCTVLWIVEDDVYGGYAKGFEPLAALVRDALAIGAQGIGRVDTALVVGQEGGPLRVGQRIDADRSGEPLRRPQIRLTPP